MKRRRALSLLLSLSLLFALALPSTAYAEENNGTGAQTAQTAVTYTDNDKGMEISKTAAANGDGTYTIKLEAYATGQKIISDITKDVPTDIVLVLDQSGSMDDDMGTVSFKQYEDETNWWGDVSTYHTRNQDYYEYRHNGGSSNLWHKLADDSYVSVSVARQEKVNYTIITNGKNNSTRNGATNYYNNRSNLYALVSGEYQKVDVGYTGSGNNRTYIYTLPDGTQIASSRGNTTSPTFSNIDGNVLYLAVADDTATTYTYTYTDSKGNVQPIGTSTGADTVYSPAFYERITSTSGGGKRIDAIKSAATTFVDAVAKKAAGADGDITTTSDNIKHRIAVVGFASQSGWGNNTELLSITGENSGDVGVAYNNIENQNYKDVMQSMDTANGQSMVKAAINALDAQGATRIDLGMEMAKNILDANPVPADEKQRNRVVIVFTDGAPTDGTGFQRNVANSAISTANEIKAEGTTVYSIGVFSGANAGSTGEEPDRDYYQQNGRPANYTDAEMSAACNWFMQHLSSNTQYPQSPSYYLSAADSASLNNIFQQISDQIETGGSSSTLTNEAVVKDIISPQFTLPTGTTASDITLETYRCTGKNGSDYTWSKNADAMGATASISGDQVNVTGFNFSDNYVGTVTENGNTSYRGNKLVIKFNVKPKDGFLGGNDVYTNTSAGIYENKDANDPLLTFDRPQVNVPIKNVTVTAPDKNVYLKGTVTADDLENGATVDAEGITLKLDQPNYGLEPWQYEYVDIDVKIMDEKGNNIPTDGLKNLTEDTTYSITVTVKPKTGGTNSSGAIATKTEDTKAGKINVFTPELTYADSNVYYGDTAPTNFSSNLTSTKWKHGNTESSTVTMIGQKPTLEMTYTPEAGKIADGKINTKQDVAVDVAVKIDNADVTNKTTFIHTKCGDSCTDPANGKFWLHVNTCTLTVTKQGGANDESYVFDVYKDNKKYSEVTVEGNGSQTLVELPVGTYKIVENTGWSWRYPNPTYSSDVTLNRTNTFGTITCTNEKKLNNWLNGFSQVERNIIGVSKNAAATN